jgi:hypothetical protein
MVLKPLWRGWMKVTLFPCGPAANESELRAFLRLKGELQAEIGEGAWVLLTNIAFSVTHQLQSDEIDLVVIGPSGVRVDNNVLLWPL